MKRLLLFILVPLAVFSGPITASAQQEVSPAHSELVSLAIDFVNLCAQGDFQEATKRFDSTMKGAMPPYKLEETWSSILLQVGPYVRRTAFRTQRSEGYDIVFVTCEFEKVSLDVKVVFDDKKQIAGLWFAPAQPSAEYEPAAYIDLDAFKEQEVTVGTGEWVLPGTLSIPSGDGPFPGVVLVHGSGPHDRDESFGPNKPFRDLAWGLASRGIAVLRYEKRTKEHASKLVAMMDRLTVMEETIEDALAAASLLRDTNGIDRNRVFVLGHSLGAMCAPRIGTFDDDLAGLIILAGPTRPMEDLIVEQSTYVLGLDGSVSESEKEQLEMLERAVARVKDPSLIAASAASELPLGIPPAYWLDLHGYRPEETVKELNMSILILHGERDYQVTMEDFEGWKRALEGKKNVMLTSYPSLNHIFMEGKGKSTPDEYNESGHVAIAVINDIADWIKKQ